MFVTVPSKCIIFLLNVYNDEIIMRYIFENITHRETKKV